MKYCPICGTMTFNDAQFCMSCLHVFKIDDETIREVEEEKEPLLAAPTPQLNLAYPWWAKEGFTRWPGAQAKLKFNLGDCDDDCFVYRRTKDEFEEFIYWNEEHFAYKAFMRKHGVPYKSEYADTHSDALDCLKNLERGLAPARDFLGCLKIS